MLKRKYGPNEHIAAEVVDRLDDMAVAIRCFNCQGVFQVGSFGVPSSHRKPRPCPHCRQTVAFKNAFDDCVKTWINEDGRSNRKRAA